MPLPELTQIQKEPEVRATLARPPGAVTEAETCFRTPSRKENFEGQPNRTVAEHRVPPKVKGKHEEKFGSVGKL
jgi:hypothetical protein